MSGGWGQCPEGNNRQVQHKNISSSELSQKVDFNLWMYKGVKLHGNIDVSNLSFLMRLMHTAVTEMQGYNLTECEMGVKLAMRGGGLPGAIS